MKTFRRHCHTLIGKIIYKYCLWRQANRCKFLPHTWVQLGDEPDAPFECFYCGKLKGEKDK